MSMHILLTGGAGFIGRHTAQALLNLGHRVRVFDILDPQIHGASPAFPSYKGEIECIRGDIRNPLDVEKALEGIDAVYHFASLTGVGQSMYHLRSYSDVNITGTATLLEAIITRKQPLERLVLSSSRAVYGEGTGRCDSCGVVYPSIRKRQEMELGTFHVKCPRCGIEVYSLPTKEDRPLDPISIYGWTKRQQEEQCRYVAQTFGVPVTILRYFNVYGSGQSLKNPYTGVVSIFYSRLLAHQPISLYEHGTPIRDFVHINDVVQGNLLALEAAVEPGTCVNIGAGRVHTIVEVVHALARACGQTPKFEDRGEFRVGDIHSCYADLERARQLLGFEPRVSLEEGMKEFESWAKTQAYVDLYQKTVGELEKFGLFGRIKKIGDVPRPEFGAKSNEQADELIETTDCPSCHCSDFILFKRVDDRRHGLVKHRLIARCSNCSLVYLRERVPLSRLNEFYPADYISYQFKLIEKPKTFRDRLFNQSIWDMQRRRLRFLERIMKKHRSRRDLSHLNLLDFGCGTGLFLSYVAQRWKCSVKGYDFSPENVRYAREKLGLDVDVLRSDELGAASGMYDIITMNHYLEHEYDPVRVLRMARGMLAPNGLLLIYEVPHIDSLSARLFGSYWYDYDCPRHTLFFNKKSLKRLLNDSGFSLDHFSFSLQPIDWSGSIQHLTGWDLWRDFHRNFFLGGFLFLLLVPMSVLSSILGLGDHIIAVARKK